MLTLDAKSIAGLKKDGYLVKSSRPGSGAHGQVPDSGNPKSPWADVRVRQAAQHAIDTEAIVKTILYGEAEPTNQYSSKGHWGYNPAVVGYPFNPTKAKQLLAEAGYPNGFKTKLGYRTNPQDDQLYSAVQGYLKVVGIDAELDPMQQGRFQQTALQGGKWEGLFQYGLSPNPDAAVSLTEKFSGSGQYMQMLLPSDYLKAIQNAVTAPDFETKQKWVQEVMKLMVDKYCLLITLYCPTEFAVSQKYVHNHGLEETPNSILWTPEDVWMER
jgi:ABC-type transport system substrate-binding protein